MFKALKEIYQDRDDEDIQFTRDRHIVEIRKSKRQEQFNRRRRMAKTDGKEDLPRCEPNSRTKAKVMDERYQQEIKMLMESEYSRQMFPELSKCLQSEDLLTVHKGVIGIRKVIFIDQGEKYIQELIGLGIVDQLISFIRLAQYPQIQYEAAWIIEIMLFGSDQQCIYLVECGALEAFSEICKKYEKQEIVEHAIFGIGNACETGITIPSSTLQKVLVGLQQFCSNTENAGLLQYACWAIQSIIRQQISPSTRKRLIAFLCCLVANDCIFDKEILHRCLIRLGQNCISRKGYHVVSIFKESKILPKIMSFIEGDSMSLCHGARQIIGNLSAQHGPATDLLFELNVLDYIEKLLWSSKQKTRRDTCWIYSNLALGSLDQVMTILNRKKSMDRLYYLLLTDFGLIKREIIHIFANLSQSCDDYDIESLFMEIELFDIIADMLEIDDERTITSTLENLHRILEMAEGRKNHERIIDRLERNGGVELLDKLQEDQRYNAKAMQILMYYFGYRCDSPM